MTPSKPSNPTSPLLLTRFAYDIRNTTTMSAPPDEPAFRSAVQACLGVNSSGQTVLIVAELEHETTRPIAEGLAKIVPIVLAGQPATPTGSLDVLRISRPHQNGPSFMVCESDAVGRLNRDKETRPTLDEVLERTKGVVSEAVLKQLAGLVQE